MRRQLPARASVAVGSSKKVRCSPDFITIGCPSASVSFAGRIHVATTWLGPDHGLTLALAHGYAYSLVHPGGAAPRSDVVESLVVLSDAVKRLTRKLGANHPETRRAAHDLGTNRSILKTMDSTVEK